MSSDNKPTKSPGIPAMGYDSQGNSVLKYPCDRCGNDTVYDEDDHRTMTGEELLCWRCKNEA